MKKKSDVENKKINVAENILQQKSTKTDNQTEYKYWHYKIKNTHKKISYVWWFTLVQFQNMMIFSYWEFSNMLSS